MPRLTVTISDEHDEILQRKSDVGEAYRSKSEVVRECIEAFERVEDLSEQVACLEAEVELLRDQRAQLTQKAARVDELEGKLRKLQAAYHQAIDEGRSPQELDPVETDLDAEPSATALIEEAESDSETPERVESTTADSAIDAADGVGSKADTAVSGDPTPEPSGQAAGAQAGPSARSNTTSQTTETDGPPARTQTEESNTQASADGGVEIDEELLYQSPSVGSRIKSALFGGPGGNR